MHKTVVEEPEYNEQAVRPIAKRYNDWALAYCEDLDRRGYVRPGDWGNGPPTVMLNHLLPAMVPKPFELWKFKGWSRDWRFVDREAARQLGIKRMDEEARAHKETELQRQVRIEQETRQRQIEEMQRDLASYSDEELEEIARNLDAYVLRWLDK